MALWQGLSHDELQHITHCLNTRLLLESEALDDLGYTRVVRE